MVEYSLLCFSYAALMWMSVQTHLLYQNPLSVRSKTLKHSIIKSKQKQTGDSSKTSLSFLQKEYCHFLILPPHPTPPEKKMCVWFNNLTIKTFICHDFIKVMCCLCHRLFSGNMCQHCLNFSIS